VVVPPVVPAVVVSLVVTVLVVPELLGPVLIGLEFCSITMGLCVGKYVGGNDGASVAAVGEDVTGGSEGRLEGLKVDGLGLGVVAIDSAGF
jgi:hypothetical protein